MTILGGSLVPTAADAAMARQLLREIGGLKIGRKDGVALPVAGKLFVIPAGFARLLIDALGKMAEGKTVAMLSMNEEISPQEAAELLKVSRPFASKLFDEGGIPSRKVGTHRRALASDVLAYKEREKKARLKTLDRLAAEGQRLELDY